MYLARQPASRMAHGLPPVTGDAGSVLMNADDRRVDHLHGRIIGTGQRVHNFGPDASPPPTNEAIVAGGIRTEVIGQVAPWCSGSQHPEDANEDTPVVHPWHAARLVW